MELRELLLVFGGSLEKKGGEEQLSVTEQNAVSGLCLGLSRQFFWLSCCCGGGLSVEQVPLFSSRLEAEEG